MSSLPVPEAPQRISPPVTRENLEYADLAVIDLSKAHDAQGRAALAVQVSEAMRTHGFFYVINHGYTAAQTERMFDIADVPFSCVNSDEKRVYTAQMKEAGSFQGYKPRQYWHIDNGIHDQMEGYSIHRDVTKRQHPEAVRPFLAEIEAFTQHTHLNVVYPILRLLALGLELPEDELVNLHVRPFPSIIIVFLPNFVPSYPRSQDEELKTNNVWMKGHTDIGTITVLYSQPVAALQILGRDGKWKWVKHIENALARIPLCIFVDVPHSLQVINAADTLELLSGGYYKATVHRVIQPPADQQNRTRLGVLYFCMTDDDVKLVPFSESPVLKRVGIIRRYEDNDAPTMEEWRKGRTSADGVIKLKATAEGKVEELNNGVVKHYN
ncbi:Clavaminate synthase-like protein [Mycena epipterygia]|nr:Clavaminate synthase-like protein [Mycena epipterygia]